MVIGEACITSWQLYSCERCSQLGGLDEVTSRWTSGKARLKLASAASSWPQPISIHCPSGITFLGVLSRTRHISPFSTCTSIWLSIEPVGSYFSTEPLLRGGRLPDATLLFWPHQLLKIEIRRHSSTLYRVIFRAFGHYNGFHINYP